MAESEEELKSLLMKVKEESEKAGLKSNIQKMKIMASGPIPSWQSEAMNWYFWTVVLEKTLESPLDLKKIQLVHPKGNQSWIFIGRTDAEAETPILLLQEGGPLPGPETGLLSNTRKWTVRGDTCADNERDFVGKAHARGEQ